LFNPLKRDKYIDGTILKLARVAFGLFRSQVVFNFFIPTGIFLPNCAKARKVQLAFACSCWFFGPWREGSRWAWAFHCPFLIFFPTAPPLPLASLVCYLSTRRTIEHQISSRAQ